MKLTHIRIKDFRSFSGEHEFDLTNGVNYFVGPNNCGKSNLIKAIELALDPDAQYLAERDRPAREGALGAPPTTRITLTFHVGQTSPERTLLKRAQQYEVGVRRARGAATVGNIRTYAADHEVRLATTFGAGGTRQSTFQAKGFGAASLPADSREHRRLESQFREAVRFAVVHSGEDLASLLKGKFKEILHLVIADHLRDEVTRAEAAREEYLSALQTELLDPLRAQILERVGSIFTEITVANLVPDVPSLADTLSSVDVQLGDVIQTELTEKGTGVRGAVLVSMLQYLAEQSRRSLVLAVEEPEAFLHPAAQEAIKDELEGLATRADVSLLVTTHSPYVISRQKEASVTELRKRQDGVTYRAGTAMGDESRAEILGGLYREAGMAKVLERALEIPDGARAVLVTEGYTDGAFFHAGCVAAGRPELLDGVHVIPAGGAKKVVFQSVLADSATELPVVALLDHDKSGREARDKLEDFGWSKGRELLSLLSWPGACTRSHDVEIEDLLPAHVVRSIVKQIGGEDVALDGKERCGSGWHFRCNDAWKSAAVDLLPGSLTPTDSQGFVWLGEELNLRIDRIEQAKTRARDYRRSDAAGGREPA